jgi:hypothetical protein
VENQRNAHSSANQSETTQNYPWRGKHRPSRKNTQTSSKAPTNMTARKKIIKTFEIAKNYGTWMTPVPRLEGVLVLA